ncbi:MAG: hypothetical protein COB09_18965 [Thalassobium sp.]|nr:MAG: hypothetical protein COB09_18965 [Thalassobium sp.]
MENELRIERLTMLADMLDRHDELFKVVFDIRQWGSEAIHYETKQHEPELCGSAACALGSAAMYPPFMKQGLRLRYDSTGFMVRKDSNVLKEDVTPFYDGHADFMAGSWFFGITGGESCELFDGDEYGYTKVTAAMVAERVRKLIKVYV